MKLTDSELQIMELFWSVGKPLTSLDILSRSPADKQWKDKSIYIMIQTLQKKNAISEIGAVKGEKGKYLRLLEPTFSRQDYYSAQISVALDDREIPAIFSALVKDIALSEDTIKELEAIIEKKKSEKA